MDLNITTNNKTDIKKTAPQKNFLVHTGMQRETWWKLTVITGIVLLFITVLVDSRQHALILYICFCNQLCI